MKLRSLIIPVLLSGALLTGSAQAQGGMMGGGMTNFPSHFSIGDTIDIGLDIQFPGAMMMDSLSMSVLLTNGTDTITICTGTLQILEPGHIVHTFTCDIPDDITLGDYTVLIQTPFGTFAMPGGGSMHVMGDHDVNRDGRLNIVDLTDLIGYIFSGGPPPLPGLSNGDLDCDGQLNVGDVTKLIEFMFQGGTLPCYDGGSM